MAASCTREPGATPALFSLVFRKPPGRRGIADLSTAPLPGFRAGVTNFCERVTPAYRQAVFRLAGFDF